MKDPRNLYSPKNRPHRERNIEITRAYVVGKESVRAIAEHYNLSRNRIDQIIYTALRQHRNAGKLKWLRLPDDIATILDKQPLGRMIGNGDLPKAWTPADVEAETKEGYSGYVHYPVKYPAHKAWLQAESEARISQSLLATVSLSERLRDYMREVGIEAMRSPALDTPASAQTPQNAPVPHSK